MNASVPPTPGRPALVAWRRIREEPAALIAAAALTVIVRIPTLLSPLERTFDEGVYAVSVLAMRHGEAPFRDVFSSQGPLFLPILWLIDVVGLRQMPALRLGMMAAAVATALGTYVIARRVGSPSGAIIGAVVMGTSAAGLAAAGPVQSDGIALAFAVWGVAVALGAGKLDRSRPIVTGLLLGAAAAVKSVFAVPAGLAVLWLYASRRNWRAMAATGVTGISVVVAAAFPWGLGNVWEQSVRFQLDAPRDRDPLANLGRLARALGRDAPFLAFVGAGLVGTLWRRRRPRPAARSDHRAALMIWLGGTVALLLFSVDVGHGFERFVAFALPPTVALVVMLRPPVALAAVAMVATIPLYLASNDDLLWSHQLTSVHEEVVAALESLPGDSLVISDRPGLPWIAGRRPPGNLVDPSWARVQSGSITAADIVAAADLPEVCAVLFYSGRFDWMDLRLGDRLAGYELAGDWGGGRRLYISDRC